MEKNCNFGDSSCVPSWKTSGHRMPDNYFNRSYQYNTYLFIKKYLFSWNEIITYIMLHIHMNGRVMTADEFRHFSECGHLIIILLQ